MRPLRFGARLSAVLPVFTEVLVRKGGGGGASTGTIYGVSTLGNISGVMVTTFLLIPHFPTSTLLILWMAAAAGCFGTFQKLVATGLGYLTLRGRKQAASLKGSSRPNTVRCGSQTEIL